MLKYNVFQSYLVFNNIIQTLAQNIIYTLFVERFSENFSWMLVCFLNVTIQSLLLGSDGSETIQK